MAFYRTHIYPRLVKALGDPPPIREIRQGLIPQAQGKTLEIGAGSGVNFTYYDPARVSILYALEPNPGMIRLAERQQRQPGLSFEFINLYGEHIPLADNTLDTVVSTFTLCTIAGIADVIREIKRVLKADGKLVFFELGLAPDPAAQRWQRRLEPVYRRIFQGLYLTREIPALIMQAGFRII